MNKNNPAATASYSEQYKDPRWQKKRLEILNRDQFTCSICGSDKETLHVHHIKYTKGKKVWDYDNSNLITFCHNCHEDVHRDKKEAVDLINKIFESTFIYQISFVEPLIKILKMLDEFSPIPVIAFQSLRRAITTVEDFCRLSKRYKELGI